jgi:hypothetical protein
VNELDFLTTAGREFAAIAAALGVEDVNYNGYEDMETVFRATGLRSSLTSGGVTALDEEDVARLAAELSRLWELDVPTSMVSDALARIAWHCK